jgi:uncharacterized protein (DUF1501 family)
MGDRSATIPEARNSYRAGQALFVRAVATPYRERSHFDGKTARNRVRRAVGDDTAMQLLDLYHHTDPTFAGVLEEHIGIAAIAYAGCMDTKPVGGSPAVQTGGIAQVRTYFAEVAAAAAKFLGRPDGPRVGALALDGWDTHVN